MRGDAKILTPSPGMDGAPMGIRDFSREVFRAKSDQEDRRGVGIIPELLPKRFALALTRAGSLIGPKSWRRMLSAPPLNGGPRLTTNGSTGYAVTTADDPRAKLSDPHLRISGAGEEISAALLLPFDLAGGRKYG